MEDSDGPPDGGHRPVVRYRVWPPVAVFAPLLAGVTATGLWGDPAGLLPGQPTTTVVQRGPFAVSRNPLHVGLLALYAGLALLVPSVWALVLLPVAVVALEWGAIRPEEALLRREFGAAYDDYARRVRRWL